MFTAGAVTYESGNLPSTLLVVLMRDRYYARKYDV
jgi:hypothetical protein